MKQVLQIVVALALITLAWRVVRSGEWEGWLLGVPYDLRPPTLARLHDRLWNPADPDC